MLFRFDPVASYELHKLVAEKEPDEANPQFEWAMQQHRAGEYAGAAASYARYVQLVTDFAPAWGLYAECLIRLGKIQEAVAAWSNAEESRNGTLAMMESMLCEIKLPHPELKRQQLLHKITDGDVGAARQLIALDCAYEVDWWNSPIRRDLLKNDLDSLRGIEWKSPAKINEVFAAAEVMLAEEKMDVTAVLKKHGYLLDDANTLPHSGSMLSCMISAVEDNGALTTEQIRDRWSTEILEQARESKDVEAFNVAAHLAVGTPALSDIQREAWTTTSDSRFATGLVVGLSAEKDFGLEHPDLVAALKQFPEESMIARFEVLLSFRSDKPLTESLIRAIKAEYLRLSIQRGFNPRRSAQFLRAYFGLLKKELANPKSNQE